MFCHFSFCFGFMCIDLQRVRHSFPTRRSSDLPAEMGPGEFAQLTRGVVDTGVRLLIIDSLNGYLRSEEHTSELQSQSNLVCRLLREKKNQSALGQSFHPISH